MILFMSIFSVFTGLIYNEAFSIPLAIFGGSAYSCSSDPLLSLIDMRTNEAACPEAYTTGLVQVPHLVWLGESGLLSTASGACYSPC